MVRSADVYWHVVQKPQIDVRLEWRWANKIDGPERTRRRSPWDALALAYYERAPGKRFNRFDGGTVMGDGHAIVHSENDLIRIIAIRQRVHEQAIASEIADHLKMIFRGIEFRKCCDSGLSRVAKSW